MKKIFLKKNSVTTGMRFAIVMAMLPCIGCQAPAVESHTDADITNNVREEITKNLSGHADALARQDLDTVLDLYTEDAIVRPANMEPVHGHAELRSLFTNWWAAMAVKETEYSTEELDVHGDNAYQIGTYKTVLQLVGESTAVPDRGSFMVVWKRREDGSWKYHRGIFNSSLPATETITSKGDQIE